MTNTYEFKNNFAHSVMVGWNMMKYTHEEGESEISCIEGTNFAVYKAWMDGVLVEIFEMVLLME